MLLEVNVTSGHGSWSPDPPQSDPPVPTDNEIAAATRPPRRRRLWWFLSVLVAIALTAVITQRWAYDEGVQDTEAKIAASASAAAAIVPPANLYCPDQDSDEAKNKAIRDKPVVVIAEPPAERVLVMRKAVVVVLRAEVTVDVVICGNDAVLALEKTPRPTARILMQGGTDTQTKGAGPMIFLVDDIGDPPVGRIWFSNRNPQIVRCSVNVPKGDIRPCSSYYSTAEPSPSSSAPKPSRTK